MTDENVTKPIPPDDIDLVGLLEKTYFFFRRFKKIFIIAIIAGLLFGLVSFFTSSKMYESKLILHSSFLTNQEELEIIDYWNQLLERHEDEILAPILNCNPALLKKLVSLEAVEIQKNYSSTDPNGFYITAKISDNSILPELQNALVFGLNNNIYSRQKVAEKQENLLKLIDRASREETRLDTIKTRIEESLAKDQKNAATLLISIQDMSKDQLDLAERLATYQSDLKALSSVQVLQGFIPLNTPVSRSLKVTLVVWLIVALAIAYLFSLLKYIEDRLKKRLNSDA